MADVKWIKITTDIFADEKILLIESMPDADAIIVIWFKLLCMAGTMNNRGVFILNNKIAYTDEMLSTIFRRPLNTVRMALDTFEQFGMIERIDGVITIPNWDKHQSLDALEHKREYQRELMRKRRAEQKLLCEANSDTNSEANVSGLDKNRKDKKRIDKNIYGEYKHVQLTQDEYDRLAKDYSTTERDEAIKFLDEYIEEKGYKSKSHNLAIRRWVLEAVKERNKKGGQAKQNNFNAFPQNRYDFDALEKALVNR